MSTKKILLLYTGPSYADYVLSQYPTNVQAVLDTGANEFLLLTADCFNLARPNDTILKMDWVTNKANVPDSCYAKPSDRALIEKALASEIETYNGKNAFTLTGYVNQLVAVANGLISKSSNVKLWFGLPRFLPSAQPVAVGYAYYYEYFIIKAIQERVPNKNIMGYYFGQEDINYYYTPFNANLSSSYFGNPVVQCMSMIRTYINQNYPGKQFMWIPYFHNEVASQTLTNITDDGLRIGYIANQTNIFDYVILQPSAFNNSNNNYRLTQVKNCIAHNPPAVVNKNNSVVGSLAGTHAEVGFEMEIEAAYATGTQYQLYVSTFTPYKNGTQPIAFYAGPQEDIIFNKSVNQAITSFFK